MAARNNYKQKRQKPYLIEYRYINVRSKSIFAIFNTNIWMTFRRYYSESARNQALAVMVKKEANTDRPWRQIEYRIKENFS